MSIADALSDISADRYTYDPNTTPPEFGKALRKYWAFEESYVNVNHGEFLLYPLESCYRHSPRLQIGSYGSLPLPVKAEVDKLLLLAERNPDRFHRVIYRPLLIEAR